MPMPCETASDGGNPSRAFVGVHASGQRPATTILRGVPGGAMRGSTATAAMGGRRESLGLLSIARVADTKANRESSSRSVKERRKGSIGNIPFDQWIAGRAEMWDFFPHCRMMAKLSSLAPVDKCGNTSHTSEMPIESLVRIRI